MQNIYPYVLIVHLFCAIVLLGYIFFDVVIFNRLRGVLGDDFDRAKQAIGQKAVKIMPLMLLLLILTGGMMMSSWVGSKAGGYFQTSLQQIFMAKVILAFAIFVLVSYSLSMKIIFKKQPVKFIKDYIHHIALLFGFFIVLFAKIMYLV